MSAPSGVPWFARTADMDSFSGKQAFVFGDATHTVGMVKFLRDELAMQIAGAGTYLEHEAGWVREQLAGYLPTTDHRPPTRADKTTQATNHTGTTDGLLVTDRFQEVAQRIAELQPNLVCGTQMERHSCRKLDIPCVVIAPPTHIENHLLGYKPMLGFDGADVLADAVYTTATLGLEKHLIDMFGDAGLELDDRPPTTDDRPGGEQEPRTENREPMAGLAIGESPARPLTRSPVQATWTDEAQAMLKKVPFFVRGRVQRNVEKYATEQGHASITADVLLAARETLGG